MELASGQSILFFFEGTSFSFTKRTLLREWLQKIAKKEKKRIAALNYIFCTDKFLLSVNQKHLNHNTYTDIITFGYSPITDKEITGDIFISIERVKENALTYETTFQNELKRVMAHGLLHLCGYKDKSASDKITMKKKEDKAVALFHKLNTKDR
ncbi:MAG TPA: rRNA maturation RNase YbeY [Cytophagaceae bacterium]|jgi:probable rRNA maturation factor|nr:rRNA maturation RNase YbeY [Cytophagaceae bacterium]